MANSTRNCLAFIRLIDFRNDDLGLPSFGWLTRRQLFIVKSDLTILKGSLLDWFRVACGCLNCSLIVHTFTLGKQNETKWNKVHFCSCSFFFTAVGSRLIWIELLLQITGVEQMIGSRSVLICENRKMNHPRRMFLCLPICFSRFEFSGRYSTVCYDFKSELKYRATLVINLLDRGQSAKVEMRRCRQVWPNAIGLVIGRSNHLLTERIDSSRTVPVVSNGFSRRTTTRL